MGYKVCVYAICKNEARFVKRFMASMGEADWVVVLDTGSSDGTPELLREAGARVEIESISPWRFDVARNRSMEMIPKEADICVCIDLDEEFEPGWREALESSWTEDATQARYRYTWNFRGDGSEGVVFFAEKVHRNGDFRWVGPVHEVLRYDGPRVQNLVEARGVQLNHRADPEKSRGQYLPLLELAVQEEPENDRNAHYLGREYMYHGMWDACVAQLKRHLALKRATWPDERCASMRFIAHAEREMGHEEEAERWLYRAVAEAPHLREPWVDMARLMHAWGDWQGVVFMTARALAIQERPQSYICEEEAWGALPYDLRAVGLFQLGLFFEALDSARKALSINPHDVRLKENMRLIEQASRAEKG